MRMRDKIYSAFSGQRRQKQTTSGTLKDSRQAYRTWKEVAAASGISERTLRRIRAGSKVSKQTQSKLDRLARDANVRRAGTKPGRARAMDTACSNGARIKVDAAQGPKGKGSQNYKRPRTVDFAIPPEAMEELRAAYENGDDEAAESLIEDLIADYGWPDWTPMGGWEVGSVDSFTFSPL